MLRHVVAIGQVVDEMDAKAFIAQEKIAQTEDTDSLLRAHNDHRGPGGGRSLPPGGG